MRKNRSPQLTVAVLLGAALLAGCGDSPTTPGIQPQIVNNTDSFEYQTSSVRNYSGSATYTWQNTGVAANVNQATTVTAGSISVVITDAAGTQVYSRSLSDNGTFVTADGVAGAWKIRVVYSGASGTVNFRVEKKT
jgi:hypothetical protein